MKPPVRIRNPETLALLGQQLRRAREVAGLSQGRVKNMRQGTVSKIENGLDVTLDTLLTYAASLGLEVAFLPLGQAALLQPRPSFGNLISAAPQSTPSDLLTEFDHLRDPQ
ncbi:helix-turn-helix domain-containing protein [Verminephrobacter aporrectodeae]|uniref:XRE family transcriptional regulator n=1 Tax=Verminephrobacter aporrectodeae subsp. tuberculatae TaxID=1110392 RepID=A0ABT3KQD8_9BURK|nr:helix-turn-helix transcriptional regulator [Verminephrobacter aporrectodeae]MCW5220494.1 XRE family transcriptional regulator [Verminephrobacter aporrectodeae subsp. tuberculatae]MCW5255548.1 XRE family transcriptional regulator [Verminephrobacter aporrectodeae subsp. tuberculatae]MCW5289790.1 XRE family transcriptional regulator [Verminephrobacter aporrectodeae subsp. tuberculatae]MCW5320532.1 XRE family transcriptional regulator [Verminephrobacter aporrectodeae subsp. tuberculatae]MCW8163